MTKLLNGNQRAKVLIDQYKRQAQALFEETGVRPKLVVITVGDDPASKVYVGQKQKKAEAAGFAFDWLTFEENADQSQLTQVIDQLNHDPSVHGMIVQLPLPKHMDAKAILDQIDPKKDVDGFHPLNMGKLMSNTADLVACTPKGVIDLLDANGIELAGKHVVILGRSLIVGLPLQVLFIHRDATVTVCHSKTQDLASITRQADILVAATGQAQMIKAHHVKEGAVLVDVGISRLASGKLVGDLDFDSVKDKASAITPVPGGVGPMTVAMLLGQTLEVAKRSARPKV